jgi:hypothetical protein
MPEMVLFLVLEQLFEASSACENLFKMDTTRSGAKLAFGQLFQLMGPVVLEKRPAVRSP